MKFQKRVVFEHPVLKETPVGCFWTRSAPIGGSSWTVNPRYCDFEKKKNKFF